MNKNRIRLTESQLHKAIKESVYKVLNEISCGGTSKQGNHYDNWDGGFGDNWSDEQWSEYEKKRAEKYKDMPNRDYFNESKGFANKEQSKMMDWKKKRTDVFYDKEGKPISKKYTPRDKDGIPKPIKVRESQLRNIIKESINIVLQEAYNSVQYANLAGQANGALNSFGGKVKGFFNPQWKARKQRQEKLFAKGGDSQYNRVGSSAIANNTPNSSYQHDYFTNQYNQKRSGEAPYEIQRSQYDMPNAFDIQRGKQDGETISKQDFRGEYGVNGKNIEGYDDVTYENSSLNNAYNIGRNAAMGKNKGAKASGGYRLDGTGTQNGAVQHYGKDN